MVGIDVAFDNPIFACLEIDYEVNKTRFNIFTIFFILLTLF